MDNGRDADRMMSTELSRAELLRRTAAAGVALGVGGIGLGHLTGAASAAGVAKRGGKLRIAMEGAGTSETLTPSLGLVAIDAARAFSHFDGLVWVDQRNKLQPRLATEWSFNADATRYRIKLRKGVTWHDGKPFTADDVIYTMRMFGDPASYAHSAVLDIDLRGLKKTSASELVVPLKRPNAQLLDLFPYFNMLIVQNGFKPSAKPVGTGPFKVKSFTPGRSSMSVRNENYWMNGKPYVDSLEILSITDPTARLNSLRSGQVDAMQGVAFPDARTISPDDKKIRLLNVATPTFYTFYMDTSKPPFNDVLVRQAMMAAIDRQALINGALAGYGTLGNDIGGRGLPLFDFGLPHKQHDPDKARSLLKKAGKSDFSCTLHTAPVFPGFVESATLLQQQVKEAGIKVTLKQLQPPQLMTPPPGGKYLTMAFSQDKWPVVSLQSIYRQLLVKGAFYAESHWNNARSDALLYKAIAQTNPRKRQALWNQVQEIQWREGGNLIWTQPNTVDAAARNVGGIKPGGPFELGCFSFWDYHFTS